MGRFSKLQAVTKQIMHGGALARGRGGTHGAVEQMAAQARDDLKVMVLLQKLVTEAEARRGGEEKEEEEGEGGEEVENGGGAENG